MQVYISSPKAVGVTAVDGEDDVENDSPSANIDEVEVGELSDVEAVETPPGRTGLGWAEEPGILSSSSVEETGSRS